MGEGNAPAQRLARGVVPVRGTVDAVAFEFGWRRDEMEAGADDGGVGVLCECFSRRQV